VYGGYIIINNNYETYTVSYIGQPWNLTWPDTIVSQWNEVGAYVDKTIYPINQITPAVHGYANYPGLYTWTSRPLTTNATFTMGHYGYFGVLWQLEETGDYARFDLVPANTSFTPTLSAFDPSIVSIPEDEMKYPSNVTITDILGAPVVYTLEEFVGPVTNTDDRTPGGNTPCQKTMSPMPTTEFLCVFCLLVEIITLGVIGSLGSVASSLSIEPQMTMQLCQSARSMTVLAAVEVGDRHLLRDTDTQEVWRMHDEG
jgi:hypothetical protein